MQPGVVFPQTEIGADAAGVRAFAQAVQQLGYQHLMAYDHVLGADTSVRPDWAFHYTMDSMFHEPMVLFGYLAAIVPDLELVTSVIILPQRQTVLAAKQVAEVDVLTDGKQRFGVGIGWNFTEYEALNEDWKTRTERMEEQIVVLKKLWTEPLVTFQGRWHNLDRVGISPLPNRQIPIWMGSGIRDLVEGPAGVGKTDLARALASALGRELVRLQCYEGLDESKALYEWDYAKQLLYSQLLRDSVASETRGATSLAEAADRLASADAAFFSRRFLVERPVLRALSNPFGRYGCRGWRFPARGSQIGVPRSPPRGADPATRDGWRSGTRCAR